MDYKSRRWIKKRAGILKLDGYQDQVAKRYGKRIEADTVHHIYPVELYPEYEWEQWNLISVSKQTHNRLHARDTHELTEEGAALMRRTKPGEDWRKKTHKTI